MYTNEWVGLYVYIINSWGSPLHHVISLEVLENPCIMWSVPVVVGILYVVLEYTEPPPSVLLLLRPLLLSDWFPLDLIDSECESGKLGVLTEKQYIHIYIKVLVCVVSLQIWIIGSKAAVEQ